MPPTLGLLDCSPACAGAALRAEAVGLSAVTCPSPGRFLSLNVNIKKNNHDLTFEYDNRLVIMIC